MRKKRLNGEGTISKVKRGDKDYYRYMVTTGYDNLENSSMEKPKKKQSINMQNGKKHKQLIVQIYLLLLEPIKIGYLPIRS